MLEQSLSALKSFFFPPTFFGVCPIVSYPYDTSYEQISTKVFPASNKDQLPPLHQAAKDENLAQIITLVKKGIDINSKAKNGGTPLAYAINNEKKEAIKLLVNLGADTDASPEGLLDTRCFTFYKQYMFNKIQQNINMRALLVEGVTKISTVLCTLIAQYVGGDGAKIESKQVAKNIQENIIFIQDKLGTTALNTVIVTPIVHRTNVEISKINKKLGAQQISFVEKEAMRVQQINSERDVV